MEPLHPKPHCIAFDHFEVDLSSGELLKNGRKVRLQPQPFRMLELMLLRPGEVVTREEVCRALWNSDTFVDFDHSLGTAINKIREALGDSAEQPRFVETLPKRGYRFIGNLTATPSIFSAPATLAEISPRGGEGSNGSNVAVLIAPRTADHWNWAKFAKWTFVGAAVVVVVTFAYYRIRSHVDAAALAPVPFTDYPGFEYCPTFSPEGSQIAFARSADLPGFGDRGGDLYVKVIGSENLLRLTHKPSQIICPAWSPDGTQIAFFRSLGNDTGIYVVPALGGPERNLLLAHAPSGVAGPLSWSPDGKWIGYTGSQDPQERQWLHLLSVETLGSKAIPHAPGCLKESTPVFSHSGKQLAYLCDLKVSDYEFALYTLSLPSGSPVLITKLSTGWGRPAGMVWTGDDKNLIVSRPRVGDDSELDEVSLEDGSLRKLALGPNPLWPAISSTGDKLAYAAYSIRVTIWRKDLLHPENPASKLIVSTYDASTPQYSPDGKHVAFSSNRGGTWEIWMSDPGGNHLVLMSDSHSAKAGTPRWSPDSRKIAFDARQSGNPEIFVVDIEERVPRKLVTNLQEVFTPSWSHDGKWLYLQSTADERIYRCPSSGGAAEPLSPESGSFAWESIDGERVYFASPANGGNIHWVDLRHLGAAFVLQGMPAVDDRSHYTVVQQGIYFVPADDPKSIRYFDFATKQVRLLFALEATNQNGLSISPDGLSILYTQAGEENTDIMLVDHFH